MAEITPVEVQCRECRGIFETDIFTKIDRATDREIVALIFQGEFNYKQCPNCEHAGIVYFPVEVFDSSKKSKATFIHLSGNTYSSDLQANFSDILHDISSQHNGFRVCTIVRKNEKDRVVYSTGELIMLFTSWGENVSPCILSAPEEDEIHKALEVDVITKEEAEIIASIDFDELTEKLIKNYSGPFTKYTDSGAKDGDELTDTEEKAIDIALRIRE